MPTLFLICGLPGAGKTTLARQIEQQHRALRLSPDDWITQLLADASDQAELDRLRTPVETVQWDIAARVLALGIDVILDWGFWSRAERQHYRALGEALGARVEVRYLLLDQTELWTRLSQRNAALPPNTFTVTREQLALWWSWFEPPLPDEPR